MIPVQKIENELRGSVTPEILATPLLTFLRSVAEFTSAEIMPTPQNPAAAQQTGPI